MYEAIGVLLTIIIALQIFMLLAMQVFFKAFTKFVNAVDGDFDTIHEVLNILIDKLSGKK